MGCNSDMFGFQDKAWVTVEKSNGTLNYLPSIPFIYQGRIVSAGTMDLVGSVILL